MDKNDVNISLTVTGNEINCSVQISNPDCLYAFYLKKGKERIATQWYTAKSKVIFHVNSAGIYSVVCFLKIDEEKLIIETDPFYIESVSKDIPFAEVKIFNDQKIPISIYGSCVTRDILEFETKKRLDLRSYFARQSIVSAVSSPVKCKLEEINLASSFQKKQVYYDLSKTCFQELSHDGSDFLIIDLIDERFSLLEYQNSIITKSTYLVESKYIDFLNEIHYMENRGGII